METIQDDLYNYPRYYDLAYGSEWRAEFNFLLRCFQLHAKRFVQRLFEPACGTGRLLYRLAQAGYQISGNDLNPHAVEYCNKRLLRHGFSETAVVGDMSDFQLPRQVDAAFNMINSFRHLESDSLARAHLKCIAKALGKGGLYILGLHLTPTIGEPMDQESWSSRRGPLYVDASMWTIDFDAQLRQERIGMQLDVTMPTRSIRLTDEIVFRTYTAEQFNLLLSSVPELEIAGIYDFTYCCGRQIEIEPDTEDVVFVLRKK